MSGLKAVLGVSECPGHSLGQAGVWESGYYHITWYLYDSNTREHRHPSSWLEMFDDVSANGPTFASVYFAVVVKV